MPFTFGANTSDRWATALSGTWFDASTATQSSMVTGWFRITTFTATRLIWGVAAATSHRLALSGTTELIFSSGRATTADTITSSDAALVTNQWYFFAQLITTTAGAAASTIWLGDDKKTGLRKLTTARVAGSGTGNAGTSGPIIGNHATSAALSFQGDLAEFNWFDDLTGIQNVFGVRTVGTIDAEAEAIALSRIAQPIYYGDYATVRRNSLSSFSATLSGISGVWLGCVPMYTGAGTVQSGIFEVGGRNNENCTAIATATATVATFNQPRGMRYYGESRKQAVRGGGSSRMRASTGGMRLS